MVKITQEISNKIANLGFIGAIMVVMIHIPKCVMGHNAFMYKVFPDCFWGAAVPMFFIISGFLIAGHVEARGWWRLEIMKRWKTLVIPYLILNTIFFLGLVGYKVLRGGDVCVLDYFKALGFLPGEHSNNPIDGPLWYVRCLVLAVLSLPIYLPLIRKSMILAGLLVASLLLAGSFMGESGGFFFSSVYRLWGIAYFLLGVSLRIYGLPRITRRLGLVCAVTSLLISIAMEFHFGGNTLLTKLIVKLLLVIGLWGLVSDSLWPKLLTRNSFAIYAIHGIFTESAWILVDCAGLFKSVFGSPIAYYCGPILLILVIVTGAEFLRRKFPRIATLVLGGR